MQAAEPPATEHDRLATLHALDVLDSGPEEEFDALIKVASLVCGVPISLISLVDSERQWFKANIGLPGVSETPRDIAFCAHAILDDKLFEVPDAALDARFADNPLVTDAPDIRFYAGAPIVMADGSRIGTLCVIDREPRQLSATQREIVSNLAMAAAHALDGRRAIRDMQKHADELAASERSLKEARDSAQAANIAKSRFLATMSHEIRTPMNGVLGMAQLLLAQELSQADRIKYAQTILTSGHTLLALLNDILDLSKIEAGKLQLEAKAFYPAGLLESASNLFSGAAQAKGLHLAYEWKGPQDQRYQGDAHRLAQMLANLVGNAIKFTAQGNVRLECVQSSSHGSKAQLEFSVTDTGIGIAQQDIALLFKPFSQTDSSVTREFGGSGLGLSLVRMLALAMDGEVGVDSQPGIGTRFWFRVPLEVLSSLPAAGATEQPTALPKAAAQAVDERLTGHLLVAEDNPINTMVIQSFAARLGLTITLVGDGQRALYAISQRPPGVKAHDLVLMDVHMPVMDGYTATERIRQWETAQGEPRIPIIALTADAFEEDRQRCLASGMDDFLTKPVAIGTLKSVLAKWLAASAAGRA
jgi:signal transduction histidine kinase/AmiR/NasT family two-component response regulator